jgi:hypothetical protein
VAVGEGSVDLLVVVESLLGHLPSPLAEGEVGG